MSNEDADNLDVNVSDENESMDDEHDVDRVKTATSRNNKLRHQRYTLKKEETPDNELDKFLQKMMLDTIENRDLALIYYKKIELLFDLDDKNEKKYSDFNRKLYDHLKEMDLFLEKIKNKGFEIAVVGLEKTGKSSFINAWLEFNLLPSDTQRCTYTTTEIKSCTMSQKEKFEIEFFTEEEFIENLQDIQNKLKSPTPIEEEPSNLNETIQNDKNESVASQSVAPKPAEIFNFDTLKAELDEIKKHFDEILKRIKNANGKTIVKEFSKFSEVSSELRNYITNPIEARAIKRITIWSKSLLKSNKKATMYDVPGYDSPTLLHKKQTEEKCKQADVILFVKEFNKTSLNEVELKIIDMIRSHDRRADLDKRVFVVLNKCDQVNYQPEVEGTLSQIKNEWRRFSLSPDKLFPVSSLARFDEVKEKKESIKKRCKELNIDDGFDRLIKSVEDFIVLKGKTLLQNEFDRLNTSMLNIKDEIDTFISKNDLAYESEEQFKANLDKRREILISNWWKSEWKKITENLAKFYTESVFPMNNDYDSDSGINPSTANFRQKYSETVESFKDDVIKFKDTIIEKIIPTVSTGRGELNPKEAHIKIRIELTEYIFDNLQEKFSNLSQVLWYNIQKIIKKIEELMFLLPEIRGVMESSKDSRACKDQIESNLIGLILRLLRPAIHLFIRHPRSSFREKVIKSYEKDLIVIDMYYMNGKAENGKFKGLPAYLASGKPEDSTYNELKVDTKKLEFTEKMETCEEIRKQIQQDLEQFFDYFDNSLYYGCGLEAFYQDELAYVRRKFLKIEDQDGYWQPIVFDAVRAGKILTQNAKIDNANFKNYAKLKEAFAELKRLEKK